MKKFVCLIPVFNEAKNLKSLCDEIKLNNVFNIDWYIINNGSTDLSPKEFEKIIKKNINFYNVKTFFIKENRGYGNGLKVCLMEIIDNYEFCIFRNTENDCRNC